MVYHHFSIKMTGVYTPFLGAGREFRQVSKAISRPGIGMGGKISQEMPPSGGAKRWVDFWRGAIQPNFDTSSIPMSIFGMAALLTVRAKGAPACAWVMWLLHMAGKMGLHVTSKSRVCSSCCCSAWVPSKFSGSA